jgi:signal transduction histidine kinase
MRVLLFLVFFSCLLTTLYAQEVQVNSLKQLLSKQKTDTGRVRLLIATGNAFGRENNDLRLSYYQKAAEVARRTGFSKGELEALNLIAEHLNSTGNYARSLELSLQILRVAQLQGDTNRIFWIYREIVRTHHYTEDYSQAIKIAQDIKTLVHSGYFKNPDTVKLYSVIGYITWSANAYQRLNKMDSALHYRLLAYRLSQELKNADLLAVATTHLANIHGKLNKIDTAFSLFRRSIDYSTASKRFDMMAFSWLGMAGLFFRTGQVDSALHYAYQSLYVSRNYKHYLNELDADSTLSDLYRTRQQFDSAYKYLREYLTLKEKLLNQKTISQIQNLTFSEKLRQQQLEQERKTARQRYETKVKIYGLIGGLAVLLLIAFFLYRNNKIKQKANLQLQEQKQKVEEAYTNLKATQAQLIQREKMASLGDLTAGIAHEINNPLNFVNNFSDVSIDLLEEAKEEVKWGNQDEAVTAIDEVKANLQKIAHHGRRADSIVKSMMEHSRTTEGEKLPTNINTLSEEYLKLAYYGLLAKDNTLNVILETNLDPAVEKVNVSPQDIGRVLLNLFNNAFYAVNEKKKQLNGTYEPAVSVSTKKEGNNVVVAVRDNGTGMSQKVAEKVFQPFFTTKPTGEGTGLGLSLSYDIITKGHGGEISVETKEGEGAEFVVQLPAS